MEPLRPKKLLDQVSEILRRKHYSPRTEESYSHWIRRYILFHGKRHPRDMNVAEIEAFLNHLATDANVAASTQNQALAALLFLYREVLQIELERPVDALRAPTSPSHFRRSSPRKKCCKSSTACRACYSL